MIVVGLDLETTGLDKVKDRPNRSRTHLGTTKLIVVFRLLEAYLVQSDGVKVTDEVTEITNGTPSKCATDSATQSRKPPKR